MCLLFVSIFQRSYLIFHFKPFMLDGSLFKLREKNNLLLIIFICLSNGKRVFFWSLIVFYRSHFWRPSWTTLFFLRRLFYSLTLRILSTIVIINISLINEIRPVLRLLRIVYLLTLLTDCFDSFSLL